MSNVHIGTQRIDKFTTETFSAMDILFGNLRTLSLVEDEPGWR